MKRLSSFHGLTFFFLIGLILLTLFFRGRIPLWHSLIFRYLLWIGLLFVIHLSYDRKTTGKWREFVNTFSPLLFIVLIYESLGDLIHYLHPDIDPALIRIDHSLFGVHPTLWMQRWIVPWLTDLLSLFYLSYYFLPVTLVLVLYVKNRPGLYPAIFVLTFGYYISFIGYILFPAVGPRYAMTSLYTVPLEGSFITDLVRDGLNTIEHNKRDCMPSGHTQIALTVLYLAYRYEKTIFYIFLPIVCGLVLSTVYLRYHYVIDLFAGMALAVGTLIVGPRLYQCWNKEG
ncbi:MAG TPA: phosphatase PAP2 family protein [Thermodesulfobacteriota bacterium]|nr:phosphatase PAP2 family protein [Thermodesulfobacteriota bacterium]